MTTREIYLAVIAANLSDEITTHFASALEKLDTRNAAAKAKRAKKVSSEYAALFELILPMFDDCAALTCAGIKKWLVTDYPDYENITTAKVASALKRLVDNDQLSSRPSKRDGKLVTEYFIES